MQRGAIENNNHYPSGSVSFRQTEEANTPGYTGQPVVKGLAELQELLQLLSADKPAAPTYKSRFLIKRGHQFISLPVTEISYFYSKEKICFARTSDNRDYMIPHTIAEVEEMVSPELFFRASRKYVLSHGAIAKILLWFNGKLKVEIQPCTTENIMISRERVNNFKTWLGA